MQQAQAAGIDAGRGGRGGGRGGELGAMIARRRTRTAADRARARPSGATAADAAGAARGVRAGVLPRHGGAGGATSVTIGVGEERGGIDFQLQLVPTARIEGSVSSPDGTMPQGTQISLVPGDRSGMPSIPGIGNNRPARRRRTIYVQQHHAGPVHAAGARGDSRGRSQRRRWCRRRTRRTRPRRLRDGTGRTRRSDRAGAVGVA